MLSPARTCAAAAVPLHRSHDSTANALLARQLALSCSASMFCNGGVEAMQEYKGSSDEATGDGFMSLRVNAPKTELQLLKEDLQRIPAVTGAVLGE